MCDRRTDPVHWFDLFGRRLTRRDFLRLSGAVAALVSTGGTASCTGRRARFRADPFTFGVASGDPRADGLVLWSRLDADVVRDAGLARGAVRVGWEIATDPGFRNVVRSGEADARPEFGHSVHVEADGLTERADYHYRFHAGGVESPAGRTRTAPSPASDPDRFDFAFVSCQHYEQGWFTALRHLASEDVDLIVHLGDYIYEGDATDRWVRSHEGPEPTTLDGYRARYTTYRTDPDLQAAHAAAPWIVSTDDHEVDNNYAGFAPNDGQSPEAFALRRAAAYQAFYEFMPLRAASMPVGPDALMYRRFRLGGLLEMNVLDTRQYRDDQPCGDGFQPTCPEHTDPSRSVLGAAQRAWLFDGLARSSARWNVLAQQVLLSRFRGVDEDGTETFSMDKWDGYPAERQALLDHLADGGTANPIVLTGDIHSNWVGRLLRDFDDPDSEPVGTEFTGTSLTSGGNGTARAEIGARALPWNPHFDFYNSQRGYVLNAVTPAAWTVRYRRVPEVEVPGGPVEDLAAFVVEDGRPGALPA